MVITKLVLNNFGLFAGHHEFDLRPIDDAITGSRPIILFGGQNGSGKTTILEALRLCLYGQQALGLRTTSAEYREHLAKRLHRSRQSTADRAGVALEFEHMHQGMLGSFRIERTWRRTTEEIAEQLVLLKNGSAQLGLGPDYWPHLLKELVPLGLADLFFFDGEQIQRLADDGQGGPGLGAALKELLGLNLIEQLEADLKVYLTRLGTAAIDISHERLDDLRGEQERWQVEQDARRQDVAAVGTRLERIANKIAEKEAEIASRGGVFAERRSAAESEKQELAMRAKQAEHELQEACMGLLPFALAPTIAEAVLRQLDAEEHIEYQQATREVLQEQAALLALRMTDDMFWRQIASDLAYDTRARIAGQVQQTLLSQAVVPDPAETGRPIHGLSVQDRRRLRTWLDQALGSVSSQATASARALVETQVQLEQVEAALLAVPPTEFLAPLLQELSELHNAANQLENERTSVDEKLKRAGIELDALNRAIARIEDSLKRRAREEEKGGLADRVLSILPEYRRAHLRRKIGDLETAFAEYFNQLARKTEFLSHVIINVNDFTMTLVSKEGRFIPKTQLSSGEKQIYSIALLWALRAVAGRPLPVVIDTPLGRLDSNHRQNLVEHYFPNASHQVIILSTDTEIDATYFSDLTPFMAHAYHLVYDDTTGTTRAEEGYFWQSKDSQLAVIHAS